MYRKTYVEINLKNIEDNIKQIKKVYPKYKYYIGVVKNNAYGHGIKCIETMIKGGINYFAVSSLEEALEIRKINKEIPVLVLEPISLEAVKEASLNNITITIDNVEYFNLLKENKIKIKFHLKIDSGMNRFGLKNKEDVNYIVNSKDENLYLEGIYSHLSSGNEENQTYKNQIKQFKELTSDIDLNSIEMVHLDRSLTMQQHDKLEFANGVRLGIVMYGISKAKGKLSFKRRIFNKIMHKKPPVEKNVLDLKTAFTFKTHVLEIKDVKKGEIVGYGGEYTAKKDERIALLPYGFADFLYNDKNEVCIKNKLYKIILINMDVTGILIDDDVFVDDEVEIFGDKISLRQQAGKVNKNVYKLVSSITSRVPRVFVGK